MTNPTTFSVTTPTPKSNRIRLNTTVRKRTDNRAVTTSKPVKSKERRSTSSSSSNRKLVTRAPVQLRSQLSDSSSASSRRPLFKPDVVTKKPNTETVLLGEDERSFPSVSTTTKPKLMRGNSENGAVVIGLPDSSPIGSTSGGNGFRTSPRPIFKKDVVTSKPNKETLLVGEKEQPVNPQASSTNKPRKPVVGETVLVGLPESAVRIEKVSSTLRPLFRPNVSTQKPNKETFLVGEREKPLTRRTQTQSRSNTSRSNHDTIVIGTRE